MTETYAGTVDGLRCTLDGAVLRIVLDRPDKRNALSDPMVTGMLDALTVAGTDERVRVIVLSGSGEHFCAGADIVARNAGPSESGGPSESDGNARPRVGSIQRRVPTTAHRLIPLLCRVQTPVVCAVRGWAAGIGFHLALAADFTVAAGDATFWEPFAQRGFTPDSGATWLLPRRVGEIRARDLILLGRKLTGDEAADWGAIHRSVAPAALDDEVANVTEQLANGPTVALGLSKWLLHEGAARALEQQLADEAFALELSSRTDDFREGLVAFKDRRPPRFRGR